MDKECVDVIICNYAQKIFGFALSKCNNITEAEELSSRTILEVYSSLLKAQNIDNINAYIQNCSKYLCKICA